MLFNFLCFLICIFVFCIWYLVCNGRNERKSRAICQIPKPFFAQKTDCLLLTAQLKWKGPVIEIHSKAQLNWIGLLIESHSEGEGTFLKSDSEVDEQILQIVVFFVTASFIGIIFAVAIVAIICKRFNSVLTRRGSWGWIVHTPSHYTLYSIHYTYSIHYLPGKQKPRHSSSSPYPSCPSSSSSTCSASLCSTWSASHSRISVVWWSSWLASSWSF